MSVEAVWDQLLLVSEEVEIVMTIWEAHSETLQVVQWGDPILHSASHRKPQVVLGDIFLGGAPIISLMATEQWGLRPGSAPAKKWDKAAGCWESGRFSETLR